MINHNKINHSLTTYVQLVLNLITANTVQIRHLKTSKILQKMPGTRVISV